MSAFWRAIVALLACIGFGRADMLEQNQRMINKNLAFIQKNQDWLKFAPSCKKEKPQLAIIIDDIATFHQLNSIQKIPFKITPSFFPKGKNTPNTPLLAAQTPFFMVHLPLEAENFYQKEYQLLWHTDSKETIEQAIAQIKHDFPTLTYLNNHTGSKFTQTYQAMEFLLSSLNAQGITFVDSRTTPKSQTRIYYKNHPTPSANRCQKQPFLERHVFLDNSLNPNAIGEAIKQAILLAKKQGYAVAIGHPHTQTIQALIDFAPVFEQDGIEMVYINEIILD